MQALIRSMDLVGFVMINGFLLVVAGITIAAGLKARRQAAIVKGTPTSKIGMAADGFGEFEGTIEAIDGCTVLAPLTQTPCAWFSATLEKWSTGSRNTDASWSTVRRVESSAPILLRDSTGICIVDPFLADVTPTDRSRWTGPGEVPADRNPPRVGPTQSYGTIDDSGSSSEPYRYTEERIYVGDPLLVLGDFRSRRFDQSFDEDDDDEDDDDGSFPDEDEDLVARAWDDPAVVEDLRTRAAALTSARVGHGGGGQAFIVTTTPQATHIYMSEVGSRMAFYGSLVPIGIVGLMLYARFS